MKLLIIFFLITSCGKAPLFSSLEEERPVASITQAVNASEISNWNNQFNFGLQWLKKPKVGENSPFKIKFWDKNQTNFLGPYTKLDKSFCVFLWMIMPDGSEHGSSPIELIQYEDHYQADEVYFIMPGKWKIYLRSVEDPSNCRSDKNDPFIEEYQIDITLN